MTLAGRSLWTVLLALPLSAQTRTVTDEEVRRVHQSTLLIDTHNDITSRTVAGFDIGKPSGPSHTDLARMQAGNIGAQFFAVFVGANYVEGNHSANRALQMIDTVRHDIVARYPNDFALATTADEILAARRQGKIAALMGIEGGHAIEDSLRLLRDFYALGVRYMTLTHNNSNHWADSSRDKALHNGLTDFGKQVVREMNRLGMMVDISHVSDKTFWDAVETSSAPIFASHSSARAVTDVPRNMSDDMLKAVARKGGVVQVNIGCNFLTDKPQATLADVVAHIDHIRSIAGIDAVGIGTDFDGVRCVPTGLDGVSKFPNLTRALLEKGYTAQDIRKIYGENLLRTMRAVEKAAAHSLSAHLNVEFGKPPMVIDTHNDVTSATLENYDIGKGDAAHHTDIRRLRAGGVGAQFFAAYVGAGYAQQGQSAHRALEMIDTVRHDIVARYPGDFMLAASAADIEIARKKGRIAALIGIEGGHAIEDSPRLLRDFYALGVRYMTLTHTNTNGWADSSGDKPRHNGLSDLGKQIVAEMNALGMIVDISHVADKTFWDALEVSKAPLMASHSSCRALANVPRNMTDDMIQALAKKGGVVQINFNCGFLSEATGAKESALEKQMGKFDEAAFRKAYTSGEIPRATLADVVAHIDHVVKLAGIDAVGLGSDFDGVPCTPIGLDDVSKFPNLTKALMEKGYTKKDIEKIYSGNTLRVFKAVEQAADRR